MWLEYLTSVLQVFMYNYVLLQYVLGNGNNGLSLKHETVKNISKQINWTSGFGWGLTYSDEHVINTYIDVTVAGCIWECAVRPGCMGLEYRHTMKFCNLVKQFTEKERRPGYYSLTGFESLSLRPCEPEHCSAGETCKINETTGQYGCHITECGYPPETGPILGNRYDIGSVVLNHYNKGLRKLTCTTNGTWLYGSVYPYPGVTCDDIKRYNHAATSGVYTNKLNIDIYCEFDEDNSWLVFQRRQDGSENFYRTWNDYKTGFGNLNGEFWLGLQNIHSIMEFGGGTYKLQIDLEDWEENKAIANYTYFSITDETDNYRLNYSGFQGYGNLNDSLVFSNGMQFSTQDKDNDKAPDSSCAESYIGAWWYKACAAAILNGEYYQNGVLPSVPGHGIIWQGWKGDNYSLKSCKMLLQRN